MDFRFQYDTLNLPDNIEKNYYGAEIIILNKEQGKPIYYIYFTFISNLENSTKVLL